MENQHNHKEASNQEMTHDKEKHALELIRQSGNLKAQNKYDEALKTIREAIDPEKGIIFDLAIEEYLSLIQGILKNNHDLSVLKNLTDYLQAYPEQIIKGVGVYMLKTLIQKVCRYYRTTDISNFAEAVKQWLSNPVPSDPVRNEEVKKSQVYFEILCYSKQIDAINKIMKNNDYEEEKKYLNDIVNYENDKNETDKNETDKNETDKNETDKNSSKARKAKEILEELEKVAERHALEKDRNANIAILTKLCAGSAVNKIDDDKVCRQNIGFMCNLLDAMREGKLKVEFTDSDICYLVHLIVCEYIKRIQLQRMKLSNYTTVKVRNECNKRIEKFKKSIQRIEENIEIDKCKQYGFFKEFGYILRDGGFDDLALKYFTAFIKTEKENNSKARAEVYAAMARIVFESNPKQAKEYVEQGLKEIKQDRDPRNCSEIEKTLNQMDAHFNHIAGLHKYLENDYTNKSKEWEGVLDTLTSWFSDEEGYNPNLEQIKIICDILRTHATSADVKSFVEGSGIETYIMSMSDADAVKRSALLIEIKQIENDLQELENVNKPYPHNPFHIKYEILIRSIDPMIAASREKLLKGLEKFHGNNFNLNAFILPLKEVTKIDLSSLSKDLAAILLLLDRKTTTKIINDALKKDDKDYKYLYLKKARLEALWRYSRGDDFKGMPKDDTKRLEALLEVGNTCTKDERYRRPWIKVLWEMYFKAENKENFKRDVQKSLINVTNDTQRLHYLRTNIVYGCNDLGQSIAEKTLRTDFANMLSSLVDIAKSYDQKSEDLKSKSYRLVYAMINLIGGEIDNNIEDEAYTTLAKEIKDAEETEHDATRVAEYFNEFNKKSILKYLWHKFDGKSQKIGSLKYDVESYIEAVSDSKNSAKGTVKYWLDAKWFPEQLRQVVEDYIGKPETETVGEKKREYSWKDAYFGTHLYSLCNQKPNVDKSEWFPSATSVTSADLGIDSLKKSHRLLASGGTISDFFNAVKKESIKRNQCGNTTKIKLSFVAENPKLGNPEFFAALPDFAEALCQIMEDMLQRAESASDTENEVKVLDIRVKWGESEANIEESNYKVLRIEVTHLNTIPSATVDDAIAKIKDGGGKLVEIAKILRNVCDWQVEAIWKNDNKPTTVDILSSNTRGLFENVEKFNSENSNVKKHQFRHIFTFYNMASSRNSGLCKKINE